MQLPPLLPTSLKPADQTAGPDEVSRLRLKLEREQKARQQAELIAEQSTRALYEKTRQLELLLGIAAASNTAATFEQALQAAIEFVCEHMSWPLGHAYLVESPSRRSIPTPIWYVNSRPNYDDFVRASEIMTFDVGVGLPGRVVASGEPAWITNISQDSNFPRARLAAAAGLQLGAAFPVKMGEEIAAVLEFFSPEYLQPTSELLTLMAECGRQLGRVLSRVRRQEAERIARVAAERENQAKTEFFANVSHEFRTPLHGMIGMAELALERESSPEQREILRTIGSCGHALVSLLNSIVDFSNLSSGTGHVLPAPVQIRAFIDTILKSLALQAHSKELELLCQVSAAVPDTIQIDAERLRQVLYQLLSNAIKFTEKGEVWIELCLIGEGEQKALRWSVCDTGKGITAEQQERLFQAISQGDSSRTREQGGLGLGLISASRLVQMMGGQLSVCSSPGLGSRFEFALDLIAEAVTTVDSYQFRDLRVMVVEDHERSRTILSGLLSELGAEVSTTVTACTRPQERVFSGQLYDLVLFSVSTFDADAAETLRCIQQTSGMLVPLISSAHLLEGASLCSKLRIPVYLVKPLVWAELQEVLRECSTKRRKMLERRESGERLNRCASAGKGTARVLLVEDNRINQKIAAGLLRGRGFDVTIANNGREALERLSHETFDLALLDIQMPVLDGIETAKLIRAREQETSQHLPIIAFTANVREGEIEQYRQAGMDGYLAKPLKMVEFTKVLETLFRS